MPKKLSKGIFIVIDGTDGSGKATQVKLLIEKLKDANYDVETVDFPQYGKPSAALVEKYLNGDYGTAREVGPYIASIFYAGDRFDASIQIKQWLEQGKIVIANRYVSSNMGHQAGKIDDLVSRDEFLKWLDNLEFGIFKIPRPDVVILLYLPPEVGQELVGQKDHRDYIKNGVRDIHEKDLQHLKDAAAAYTYVAQKFNWPIIDCAPDGQLLPPNVINDLLWAKIIKHIQE